MRAVEGRRYAVAFNTPCNVCFTTLQEASEVTGPAFVYTLTVHQSMLLEARSILRQIAADARDNPFAPYINLQTDDRFENREWMLEANGVRVGTTGC